MARWPHEGYASLMEEANNAHLQVVRHRRENMGNVFDMAERHFARCRVAEVRFITEGSVVVMEAIVFVMSTVALGKLSPEIYNAQNIISRILPQRNCYPNSLFNV